VPSSKYEEGRIDLNPGKLRYNYNYLNSEKIIYFPSPSAVHEFTARVFRKIMASTMNANLSYRPRLVWEHFGSQTTTLTSNGRKTHEYDARPWSSTRYRRSQLLPSSWVVEKSTRATRGCDPLTVPVLWHVLAVLVDFNKPAHENFHDITGRRSIHKGISATISNNYFLSQRLKSGHALISSLLLTIEPYSNY
jgi:hypothetical protein